MPPTIKKKLQPKFVYWEDETFKVAAKLDHLKQIQLHLSITKALHLTSWVNDFQLKLLMNVVKIKWDEITCQHWQGLSLERNTMSCLFNPTLSIFNIIVLKNQFKSCPLTSLNNKYLTLKQPIFFNSSNMAKTGRDKSSKWLKESK